MIYTVPLKSKLTLETWTSRLDPGALLLEKSTIEKQGIREYAKTQKVFEEIIYFSKKE